MKKLAIVTIFVSFLLIVIYLLKTIDKVGSNKTNTEGNAAALVNIDENKLWTEIQRWRVEKGLPEYIKSDDVCSISKKRANELYTLGKLDDHRGFLQNYAPTWTTGKMTYIVNEIALDSVNKWDEKQALYNGWLRSDTHESALATPYTHACVSCAGGRFCSMVFTSYLTDQIQK